VVVVVSLGGSGAEGVAGAGAGEGWVPVRSGLVGGVGLVVGVRVESVIGGGGGGMG
jgi:hypothetical protein